MSRKLNLHLPTSNEFLIHAKNFNTPTNKRPSSSCSNLTIMREKLDKTSQFLKVFETKEDDLIKSSAESEISKEIQALKTKIAQLEREKITAIVGRRSVQSNSISERVGINARINKVKNSIEEGLKDNKDWEDVWRQSIQGDRVFTQKLENEDYAGLLLKTLQFVNDITEETDWNRTCRTVCEKKERLSFPTNDGVKSTMASTTARGNSLTESLDWSFNCQ